MSPKQSSIYYICIHAHQTNMFMVMTIVELKVYLCEYYLETSQTSFENKQILKAKHKLFNIYLIATKIF